MPLGAGRAPSLVSAWRAASRASSSTSIVSNISNPTVWPALWKPGLHAGVAVGDDTDTYGLPDLLVGGQQAIGVGDHDPLAAVAVAGADLDDRPPPLARAASSTRCSSATFSALGTSSG